MSPRSDEFLAGARERLEIGRTLIAAGLPAGAASAAYYAMLYAARAALSEEDRYAKTHGGVWSLFAELFVATGRVAPQLASAAGRAQELRLDADYEAVQVRAEEAAAAFAEAERFVETVTEVLEGSQR